MFLASSGSRGFSLSSSRGAADIVAPRPYFTFSYGNLAEYFVIL